MRRLKSVGKDHIGALLLLLMGAGVLGLGVTYNVGSLNRMGAGFIPVTLGALMMVVGLAIGITAVPADREAPKTTLHGVSTAGKPEWRGWICILAGVAAFVILGNYGGLVPASFAAVFLSALGDRENTIKSAAVLGVVVTIFGVAVFHYGLSLQLPLFQWGG